MKKEQLENGFELKKKRMYNVRILSVIFKGVPRALRKQVELMALKQESMWEISLNGIRFVWRITKYRKKNY